MEARGDHGQGATEVVLSVRVEASADTAWDILASPERFSAWMGGQASFEREPGSAFRVDFPQHGFVVAGKVTAFDAEARCLVLTWGFESGPHAETVSAGSTQVEFRVRPENDGCRVDLRHDGFASAQVAAEYDGGWRYHLGRLDLVANQADLAAGLKRTLADWFAAWNESDDEARLAALRRCCAEDVEFRDEWAVARGVERLSLHIANCHRFMPGWKIEADDDVRICRGEALVGWRSKGLAGEVKGFNHVRAAPDGTLRRIAGFAKS